MLKTSNIHKAAGILIKDRRLLISRESGKDFFVAPGGKLDAGETARQALARELGEEIGVRFDGQDLDEFGTFEADAAGQEHRRLVMDVFVVKRWEGDPSPQNEVEEILWVNSKLPDGIELGSIFAHEVIPRLVARGLID